MVLDLLVEVLFTPLAPQQLPQFHMSLLCRPHHASDRLHQQVPFRLFGSQLLLAGRCDPVVLGAAAPLLPFSSYHDPPLVFTTLRRTLYRRRLHLHSDLATAANLLSPPLS